MIKRPTWLIAITIAIAVTAGACGGNDPDNASRPGSRSADQAGNKSAEDAGLALAKCLRENGVDLPDPNSDGFVVVGPDDKNAPTREQMEKAEAACKKEREAMQGAVGKPPADLQDKMLAMARCMRDKGIDMPDPNTSGDGRTTAAFDPKQANDPKFKDAQEACRKQVGMPEPGVRNGR